MGEYVENADAFNYYLESIKPQNVLLRAIRDAWAYIKNLFKGAETKAEFVQMVKDYDGDVDEYTPETYGYYSRRNPTFSQTSHLSGDKKFRPSEAESRVYEVGRGGESSQKEEVASRCSVPDPDPSEVFYERSLCIRIKEVLFSLFEQHYVFVVSLLEVVVDATEHDE